jgi:hypothetical protein
MKANRAVVCGKSREIDLGIAFHHVTNHGAKPGARRRCRAVAIALALQSLLLYGALPALAQGQIAPGEVKRPALQIGSALRFNEDWSTLEGVDTSRTDDFWDRVKFIPFTADQSVWLSIGGQARARLEYFDNFQFGASAPKRSDTYLLSRFRLNTDLHISPYFRLYFEGKSSLSTDRELQGRNSTGFYDEIDLFNGFAEGVIPFNKDAGVTLRGGRQELLYGSQRLVGPGDFTQVPHNFDGAQAIFRIAGWTMTPFWTQAVIVDKYQFDKSSPDHQFFGFYTTAPAHLLPMSLDLYYLGANNRGATFNGTTGRENRHTIGLRTTGSPGGPFAPGAKIGQSNWDIDLEAAGQFGTVGSQSIGAGMFTVVLGYTPPVMKEWSPRAYFEFDYASGDRKPGGGVGTFNQLFPNGHGFLGYIDYIGRQNIITPNAGIAITPIQDLTLTLQQYLFWRASDRDSIFNKSSAIFRAAGTTHERYVGAETDLLATYNFTRHLQGYMGYSFFASGGFIKKTGPDSNSNFFYAALQYTF